MAEEAAQRATRNESAADRAEERALLEAAEREETAAVQEGASASTPHEQNAEHAEAAGPSQKRRGKRAGWRVQQQKHAEDRWNTFLGMFLTEFKATHRGRNNWGLNSRRPRGSRGRGGSRGGRGHEAPRGRPKEKKD